MIIQWFPGHMTKALRMIDENVKIVDGFIYVLDARAPFSSLNPEFKKRINNKPFILALNKSDLADDKKTMSFKKFFEEQGYTVVMLDSTKTNSSRAVYERIFKVLKEKIDRNLAKSLNKAVRLMVLGIPNSGKSTLINNLCGKKSANTGDKPGVTKGKQWITIDEKVELLDTPGTLYPSFENQEVAKRLAVIGSINDDILDKSQLSIFLIELLVKDYFHLLVARYKLTEESKESAPLEIFEKICKNRGFLIKGGDFDYDRCASTLLDDFRKGRIGKITLENTNDSYIKL